MAKDGEAVRRARISVAGGAEWGGGCTYGAVGEAAAGRTDSGEAGYLYC